MQVADALADLHLSLWLAELGGCVKQQDWKAAEVNDSRLCTLLALPFHLLESAMRNIGIVRGLFMHSWCDEYPVLLHGAIMSSVVDNKTL